MTIQSPINYNSSSSADYTSDVYVEFYVNRIRFEIRTWFQARWCVIMCWQMLTDVQTIIHVYQGAHITREKSDIIQDFTGKHKLWRNWVNALLESKRCKHTSNRECKYCKKFYIFWNCVHCSIGILIEKVIYYWLSDCCH